MSGLAKRVAALEQGGVKEARAFLWVNYASDGGLVYDGRFYSDAEAFLSALGIDQDNAHVFGWEPGQTAAELLEAAEERARNPPPKVTREDLGKYGRKLVDEGVTPIVARFLETQFPNGDA